MFIKELLLLICFCLLGGLRLTSTTTTTTFVAAMSIANQDLSRYFPTANLTHTSVTTMTEERIMIETYALAFLNYTYVENGETKIVTFKEEQARYGEGRVFSVTGKLVHITDVDDASDDTACSTNILGTNHSPFPNETWIALVRRGRCTFEEKVKNVYAKHASGVIVYNDKPVMNLDKMQIKGQQRDITAVITYQSTGEEMARIADNGHAIVASIIVGKSGKRPITNLNRTSVLFVSISFIVLMVLSLVWLIFYYIQRFRYLHNKDQQSRHLCSVTKKAIMKIPTKTGKSSDEKDLESDCCAICIESYKASDCIRVLPCKHEFHKNCIDPWLIEHRTCPMCKLDVLKFYGFVFLGSEESILEYDPNPSRRNDLVANVAINTENTNSNRQGRSPNRSGPALSDLIRSRDFVIDFPRVFILDAGAVTRSGDSLIPNLMPERSQSSLSLAHAKNWMANMTNKLDEQHGLRHILKQNPGDGLNEHLLNVRDEFTDSIKRRRSRSADGRYSNAQTERKQQQRRPSTKDNEQATSSCNPTEKRRNSATIRILTDASYAQSSFMRRRVRDNDIPLQDIKDHSGAAIAIRESSSPEDVNITIQVNGEDMDLD